MQVYYFVIVFKLMLNKKNQLTFDGATAFFNEKPINSLYI